MNSLLKTSAFVVITALIMSVSVFSSCSSTEEENAFLTVSKESVSISPAGGSATVSVDTNTDDWTFSITGGAGWLTGEKTDDGVTLTATANNLGPATRTAMLTIASVKANVSKPVDVTQASSFTPYLLVAETSFEISEEGGELTVEVDTNTSDWTFSVSGGDGWLMNGVKIDDGVKFTVEENPFVDDRTATVTISSALADVSEPVTITQSGNQDNINLGTPVFSSSTTPITKRISVTVDIPYTNGKTGKEFSMSAVHVSGDVLGIKQVVDFKAVIAASAGTISIPIAGVPITTGTAKFDIACNEQPLAQLTLTVIDDGKRYYPGTILVTGSMSDPRGNDAPTDNVTWYNPNLNANGNGYGYEYVQFIALEDIDFSVTPYSVVVCKNTATQTPTAKGWSEGGTRSYKFNLTEGTVTRGEFFYVGGDAKALNGYSSNANDYYYNSYDGTIKDKLWKGYEVRIPDWAPQNAGTYQSAGITSIKDAKWIRTKKIRPDEAEGIGEAGDGFGAVNIGSAAAGFLSNAPNAGAALTSFGVDGIAVYEGIDVDANTVPMDVVFFGNNANGARNYITTGMGYTVPLNDWYSPIDLTTKEAQPYFGQGGNTTFLSAGHAELTMALPGSPAAGGTDGVGVVSNGRDCSAFFKFAGELGADNSWIKKREPKTVYLLEPKYHLEHYGLNRTAQLSDIETNLVGAGDQGAVMIVHK